MARPANHHEIAETGTAETRRHSDSAVFWALVLAGSLLIHLVFLLIAHLVLKQTAATQLQPAPISVEMFDTTISRFFQPPNSSVSPATPKVAPAQSSDGSTNRSIDSPNDNSTNGLTNAIAQEPSSAQDGLVLKPDSKTSQDSRRSPTSPPPPINNSSRSSAASSNQPADSSGVAPTSSSPTESASSATNTPPSNGNTSPNPEAPPTGPIESGVRLPGVPSVVDPAANSGADQPNTQPATRPFAIGRSSVPATFSAQIKLISSPDKPDSLNYPARVQGERSKTFSSDVSGCLLTPAAFRAFQQPVILKVPLDAGGEIGNQQSISVQQSSGDSSYDNLAICTLKSWDFEPAYNLQDGTKVYKPSSLNVEIVITQR